MTSIITRQVLVYILAFIGLLSYSLTSAQTIRYVKPVLSGLGNGTSWVNASDDLQLMINNSASGDQIWVAAGTYKPNRRADDLAILAEIENDVQCSFVMKDGVKIYGSFLGTETSLAQRILPNFDESTTYSSILSGDFLGDDVVDYEVNEIENTPFTLLNLDDNACHVVLFAGTMSPNTVLDGFSITGGNAEPRNTTAVIYVNGQEVWSETGGGIYFVSASPSLSNLQVHHNRTRFGGAGFYLISSSPAMSNIIVKFNRSDGSGGGMYNDNSSPSISNLKLINNFAWVVGGGICNRSNSILAIADGVISNNIAFLHGGGVTNELSALTFQNTSINNNSGLDGGGIYNYYSGVDLTSVVLSENISNSSGGGLYAYNCVGINLNNVTVSKNSGVYGHTGGLVFTDNSTATLLNCSITENINGGIIIMEESSVSIDGGQISNNQAILGGALYNNSTVASHFANLSINNNTRGGITNIGSPSTFDNIIISGNQGGPGVFLRYSSPVLTNMTITNNTNTTGAGGGISIGNSTPTISFTTVENNTAINGGGILVSDSTVDFLNIKIDNNIASGKGGGIFSGDSNSTFSNIKVRGNTAIYGGGIYNRKSNPVLTNLLITGNYSIERGGGIFNHQSSPIITNTTISGNSGSQSGAMHNEAYGAQFVPTNPVIRNSIIWGNSSGINMGCLTCNPEYSYSLVQGVTISGQNNNLASDTNPLFYDAPNFSNSPFDTGNFSLQSSSTLINAGNNIFFAATQIPDLSSISTDLDGNIRINENVVDLGAYENNSFLGVENFSVNKFSIYPNPVKGVVQIKSSNIYKKVELWDSMGRLVLSQDILKNSFDMSGMASGIYIVYAFDGNQGIHFKVIKE